MKIQDKAVFDEQNVFGQGAANTAFAQFFIDNSYLNPLTKPGGLPQQLAHPSRQERRRPNSHLYCRRGLVPGRGQGRRQPDSRRRHRHPSGSETLARGQGGQLVQPHRRGGARRGDQQRVAGAGERRSLFQTVKYS